MRAHDKNKECNKDNERVWQRQQMQRWRKVVAKKYCKHRQNLERGRKLDHNKANEQMSSYNCQRKQTTPQNLTKL